MTTPAALSTALETRKVVMMRNEDEAGDDGNGDGAGDDSNGDVEDGEDQMNMKDVSTIPNLERLVRKTIRTRARRSQRYLVKRLLVSFPDLHVMSCQS